MPISLSTSLGRYKILSTLGAGGMGEVYLALDTRLNRQVALKVLPADLVNNRARLHRFEQEAQAASALNHPNIITIHEIGVEGDTNFIAMEFIEGETLRRRLQPPRLEIKETLQIATQIAAALDAAHRNGIVHRDIKPENVMVREDGLVKVLDFGLAKLAEKKIENVDSQAATRAQVETEAGMILGTVAYMSPEQARGLVVDARTDIFSLGVVLYEMLAGRLPFTGDSTSDVIASILRTEPKPPGIFNQDIPTELNRITAKTLEKDREERYQTVKDLLVDLKRLKKQIELQTEIERTGSANKQTDNETATQILAARTTSNVGDVASEIKNHRRGFVAGLMILLLAAIGLGYWYFSSRSTNTKQIESIAVMPFINESGNADVEYLSDGMTETLISSLSQIPKLNVKARSSVFRYKGKEKNAQTIGKELNVQAILNGTVVQRGQNLALHIELIDPQTEIVLWSADYKQPMANLVSLQSDITRDVSSKLKIKLTGADEQKLAKNYTENAEAYQLYLKGRYYWYKFPAKEFEKSGDYYQQAVNVDPNYALAYSGLAEYYGFGVAHGFLPPTSENWSREAAAANKALALDDALPNTYNALSGFKQFNGDRAGAERDLKRAVELNPNYAEGHRHYAMFLTEGGRFEEALGQMKIVLELEPLSVAYNRNLAMIFYGMRQYDNAIKQYQKALELDPNDAFTHELLGDAYEQKEMQKEAVAEWSRALTLTGDNESATLLERTFAASGFNAAVRALWQKKLEQFNEKTKRGEYVPAMNYALAYTRLADKEQAFDWLTKAEQERNRMIFNVKLDPIYDSLRADPRFQALLRRVGFTP
jgi:serine/threonine-protein kinase